MVALEPPFGEMGEPFAEGTRVTWARAELVAQPYEERLRHRGARRLLRRPVVAQPFLVRLRHSDVLAAADWELHIARACGQMRKYRARLWAETYVLEPDIVPQTSAFAHKLTDPACPRAPRQATQPMILC